MPLLLGLRADYTQERILPSAIATYAIEALLAGLFAWGAWRSRRRPISLLYVVAAVYPFFYAIPAETMFERDPKYVVVLAPVLVLLVRPAGHGPIPRALALLAARGRRLGRRACGDWTTYFADGAAAAARGPARYRAADLDSRPIPARSASTRPTG